MNGRTIDICYLTANNFVGYAIVSMASLIANRFPGTRYRIFVICENVDGRNKRLIKGMETNGVEIVTVDHNGNPYTSINKSVVKYIKTTTYIRMNIPQILAELDRVLYLDVDTIVKTDLGELYNADLNGRLLAGTPDYGLCVEARDWEPIEYIRRGIPNYWQSYINCGVMVMDLKGLRKSTFREDCLRIYEEHKEFLFCDQDIINFALPEKDSKMILPLCCNCPILDLYRYGCSKPPRQTLERIEEVFHIKCSLPIDLAYQANIIHYCGDKKETENTPYVRTLFDRYQKIAIEKLKTRGKIK